MIKLVCSPRECYRKLQMKSLYVHFPFCESKCHYCDFYSLGKNRTGVGDPLKFENALLQESRLSADLLAPRLDSLFFGGGTPSLTPPESMLHALSPLDLRSRIGPETEWTMEANPSSITLDSLKKYRAFGVNRISMGVQALKDDLLKLLGRVHSRDEALHALDVIFETGFTQASVDLLCGVPGQTLKDLESALATLTKYPITHLSCYLLTLPPHHRMFPQLPHEDTQLEHLLFIDQWMTAKGFEHYEISNFAKPGGRSKHNLNYWNGGSYLGLGPSAHSYDAREKKRWKNISSLHKYSELLLSGKPVTEWSETLTGEQIELEQWMLRLRLSEGFPRDWVEKHESKEKRSKTLLENGLLELHPQKPRFLRLTPRGFALSDHVIQSLA